MAGSADPTRPLGSLPERRNSQERRAGERRSLSVHPALERRGGSERRSVPTRRSKLERVEETAEEHIRNALQLLANVAEGGTLTDELRRDLDSAMLRLRFAVDRLEQP
jgi:hypothetical protein